MPYCRNVFFVMSYCFLLNSAQTIAVATATLRTVGRFASRRIVGYSYSAAYELSYFRRNAFSLVAHDDESVSGQLLRVDVFAFKQRAVHRRTGGRVLMNSFGRCRMSLCVRCFPLSIAPLSGCICRQCRGCTPQRLSRTSRLCV